MHLDVTNCAQSRIPLLLCEIPGRHLGTNFYHPQFFSQYQTNGFPVHVLFISNHFECLSSIGSKKFSYPCCVVTCPCCWWSFAALLIFNNGSAFRKHFVPAKGLCSWRCIISKGLLKFSICLGGILTEFNTQKRWHTAARCSVLPFPRQGSQTCPDTSSTYSTLWHWKAMPLQVGMEERQRSKAVCVSGLQFCQYS